MNNFKKFTHISIATLAGFGISSGAFALEGDASGENSWVRTQMTDSAKSAETLHSSGASTNGAAFTCTGGKLNLVIAMEPQDIGEYVKDDIKSKRRITRTMSLLINGKNVERTPWTLNKKAGLATPLNRTTPSKVYNATIRGDEVSISRSASKPPVVLNLPAVNADFADFGGPCGIGNNK